MRLSVCRETCVWLCRNWRDAGLVPVSPDALGENCSWFRVRQSCDSLVLDRLYRVCDLAQHFGATPLKVRNAVACNMLCEAEDRARYGLCFLDSHGWVVQARLCV